MKVLITGAGGQLGRALLARAPVGVEALALSSSDLDICDAEAVHRIVMANNPTHIFNAAAYTAVDRAETEAEKAFSINAEAVGHLVEAAKAHGATLVHVSTDFVFGGERGTPLCVHAPRQPLGIYGASKAAGEDAAGPDSLIVRTAWVYDSVGPNFLVTMLRLMRERDEVRVVADQIGTPTSSSTLADAIWALSAGGARGIYHVTDSGVASWYDFAVAIQEEALARGLLQKAVPIVPIATSDYPTPAARPSYSVLDKSQTIARLGNAAPHWRAALRAVLDQLSSAQSISGA